MNNNELLLYKRIEDITEDFKEALENRQTNPDNHNVSVIFKEINYGIDAISKDEDSAYYKLIMAYLETMEICNFVPQGFWDEYLKKQSSERSGGYEIYFLYCMHATNDELRKSIKLMIESAKNEKAES